MTEASLSNLSGTENSTYLHPDGTKFMDITELVQHKVFNSEVETGFVLVDNRSNDSSALIVQEARQGVEKDLVERLQDYEAPRSKWTSLFQPYQLLPIKNGKLNLGTYQSILVMMVQGTESAYIQISPFEASLETQRIDTGNFGKPLYQSSKSNYIKKGSRRIFDITELINNFVKGLSAKHCAVVSATGNTTCVLYNDRDGIGIGRLIARMDGFAPPELPITAYVHNDLEERRRNGGIPPDERKNGRAHVLAAMLHASRVFPDSGPIGKVYLVELDGPRKERLLHVGAV